MLARRQAQEWWIRIATETWRWPMGPDARLLLLAPPVVNAAYCRASACLRQGGMLLAGPGSDIAAMEPTHIIGLPAQLERLLAELPAGYAPPRPVNIATFGGAIAPALRRRAEALFGSTMFNRYGTNEAGVLSDELDASGCGVVRAGVDVRIVDEQGRELPPGVDGIVAVRSPGMAEAYLERPEESAAAFRDGWFVSSDIGVLVGERRLRLLGRRDDLVNIGGIKAPAAQLEAALREQPAIADCCAQTVHLDDGSTTLALALVLAPGASRELAAAQVRQALAPLPGATVRTIILPALPQGPGGKVDRLALLRQFRHHA
jgi:acyl-coenzyme A synthetase/AMP-(fatty) acid ligase